MIGDEVTELRPATGAAEALGGAGDFLARTALKALLESATAIDARITPATEAELSDAIHAWIETRRGMPCRA